MKKQTKKLTAAEKKAVKEKEIINIVYLELKERMIHPSGEFDNGGRWYADNSDLISCRTPSRSWPYSEMQACRTKKYVKKVQESFKCKTVKSLRTQV